tara:strand:- start:1954 stop:2304 length:351 start_codon:yes stop_codon:yes gene_type:complete
MINLKKILQESNAPGFKDRKFGAPLPTLASIQAAYEAKQSALSEDMYDAEEEDEIDEAAPKMKKSKETEDIKKIWMATSGLTKGGGSGRYGKEFDKAKKKAMQALNDMMTYSKIGV